MSSQNRRKRSCARRVSARGAQLLLFSALLNGAYAQTNRPESTTLLKAMDLEELMHQEVTLVTRTPEPLAESASAVQVITGEDVRRSGAMNLPEALRLAPNLQVAQQNAHDWAITARGFNGAPLSNNSLANKLLVMIDGRSVYTPLFGGVFWDVQNVLLEDLAQIEIVSGPGGTLWGANAVNGVINIVTKSARDTQGLYVSGAGGSFWQDFGAARYGGKVGTNFFYRVYGQRFDHASTEITDGTDARDSWDMTQGGFRADWYPMDANTLTFQGNFYGGSEGDPTDTFTDGQNLLGRWHHVFSEESDLSLQFYFDRTWRDLPSPGFSEDLRTWDLDFQHRLPLGQRQVILWGAGYRLMRDDVQNSASLSFIPPRRSLQLFSGFVQDEMALWPERLLLTVGTKLEHNDYSGLEIQPSVRLAWMPTRRQTFWGAVSRSVRSPSRFDADEFTPFITTLRQEFESEKVTAYELGYRARPTSRLMLSLAGFYNRYEDLRSVNMNFSPPPLLLFANDQRAETWGVEFSGKYQPFDFWQLRGGYTFLHQRIRSDNMAVVPGSDTFEADDPENQFLLQSMLDLTSYAQLDLVARYVSTLTSTTVSPRVPAYFTFDARLAWRAGNWEISLVGQNLWAPQHAEFGSRQIPRSIYGKVTLRF